MFESLRPIDARTPDSQFHKRARAIHPVEYQPYDCKRRRGSQDLIPSAHSGQKLSNEDVANLLEIKDLSTQFHTDFGVIKAVDRVDLSIDEGDTLGVVGESAKGAEHGRRLGLVYALGVLFSFVLLAGLVIGVKAAGHKAGWGLQFSNPQFVVILIVLVTLVALNLFGLFEINLGGRALNAAGSLASKRGTAGAFFNGVLATVLATPCTAPFLGTALGFAFTQKTPLIVLMFLTVGLGLALPYVVLSWQPAWLRFLPKPGPWMEKFKIAMGFPMLATAVWLLSLTPSYFGKRAWWLGIYLVMVALASWVYGEFIQRGGTRRMLALAVVLILLGGGYGWAIEKTRQGARWPRCAALSAAPCGPANGLPPRRSTSPSTARTALRLPSGPTAARESGQGAREAGTSRGTSRPKGVPARPSSRRSTRRSRSAWSAPRR